MKSRVRPAIGERIYILRTEKGWTQEQLAGELRKKCACTRQAVNEWESGARSLNVDQLLALSEVFGVSCDYILRGVEAEYFDICEETGLTQGSIKALKEKRVKERSLNNKAVGEDNSSEKDDLVYDSSRDLLIKVDRSNRAKHAICVSEVLFLNALIQNEAFLKELRWSFYSAIIAKENEILNGLDAEDRCLDNDSSSRWAETEFAKLQKEAAHYTANKAFEKLFSAVVENPSVFRKLTSFDNECIQIAIERGLLHE